MKNPDDVNEEQSKRIFWVVQTVFSLLLARSLVAYKQCILDPLSEAYYLTTLGLVLVYLTALWSWIDYSYSTIVAPYDFGRGRFERARFIIDLLIVMAYAFLMFSLEQLEGNKAANLQPLFNCLAVVFLLYLLSGLLRVAKYGRRASRLGLIFIFGLLFLGLAFAYHKSYSEFENRELLNGVYIAVAIAITVLYRVTRAMITNRGKWIAIDVDGVLANQINSLLPVLKQKYNAELKYEDVVEWDLKIGDTDIATIIKEEQTHKQYVQSMPTIEKASSAVNALIKRYKIAIVTSRAPESDPWTKKWLADNSIPFDAYHNSKEGNKQNTSTDVFILVDDYLLNIKGYLDRSEGYAILFSQPWNTDRTLLQAYIDSGRLFIANNWDEVRQHIRTIDKASRLKAKSAAD